MKTVNKQNQGYSSFSKLLTKIDTANLGEYQIKILKQEHDYLDKLRQQRIKEMKKKYDQCEARFNEERENNSELVEEKDRVIQGLEQELSVEISKRESAERTTQKHLQNDRNKSKYKVKDLQYENQQLKKTIKQKQLLLISVEEQWNQKIKKMKEAFQSQRRNLLFELDQRLTEAKSKNTDNQVHELRNLVARQNKALKLQNQKFEQMVSKNEILSSEYQQLHTEYNKKQQQSAVYQQKVRELYEQLQTMQHKMQKQDHSNKLKGQLEQIRRKMNQMQKGEIQKIQLIVNNQ